MPPKDKKKKEIDPEVLMRKKFRAKCLFRALGRLVMANAYWLIEGVDEYEGVEDVKRRVQQAVRSKAKKKQLLNINDKALLNKHANDRTDQEKKYIYRIIGGLKCFKKYPNHVKKKLAAVTYFKYYGPGRVIVRQHQEAHALYFIVSGDVVVSQMIFDDLLQKFISVDIGTLHTGDMFGEVSLLHNIPRTATCITIDQQPKLHVSPTSNQSAVYKVQCASRVVWVTGHCETLVLMKEDFKNVLQASVQKQWDEVRRAMSSFTYFEALDEVARREGCIVAKMKSYETNETLLGDGQGIQNFVYFILSGRCQMIESLQVIVTSRLGKKNYTLYDPFVPKVESEQDFDTKYFKNYQNLNQSGETRTSTEEASQKRASGSKQETIAGSTTAEKIVSETTAGDETVTTDTSCRQRSSTKSQTIMTPSEAGTTYQGGRGSIRVSIVQETAVIDEKHRMKIKTYFMQVCQFNPGSSFGFGEEMRDRRIIALTPVSCMLLPMVWLLQRNTANIWTRIHHYLEKKIPNKKQLFKEFYSQRRWEEYREQLVTDVVERSETVNSTSVHDVPYSIRMEEMLDI